MIALFPKMGKPNSGKLNAVSVYYGMSYTHTHARTHTCLMALCPGYPGEPVPERLNQSGFYWSKRQ